MRAGDVGADSMVRANKTADPAPRLVGNWRMLDLRFTEAVGQSRMSRWFPNQLVVSYTRTMLAALWLAPHARHIGHVGLGGGSQVKFLHRYLPHVRQEVAEINPAVLALRPVFRIPADDHRLVVHQADALHWLPNRAGAFDVLLVDAYDAAGLAAGLSSNGFHQACHAALREGGVMAINLYATDLRLQRRQLQSLFGERCVAEVVEAKDHHVLFAWREPLQPGTPRALRWWGRWQLRDAFCRMRDTLRLSGVMP